MLHTKYQSSLYGLCILTIFLRFPNITLHESDEPLWPLLTLGALFEQSL